MVSPGVDLIRRMAGGDREALAAFYDLYAPLAFGLLRRMLRDVDEAAEVLQDVFWELWRAAGEYDPRRGSPEAWVTVRARSRESTGCAPFVEGKRCSSPRSARPRPPCPRPWPIRAPWWRSGRWCAGSCASSPPSSGRRSRSRTCRG